MTINQQPATDSMHRVTAASHAVVLDQLRADRESRREMTPDEARTLGQELIRAADQADPAGSEANQAAIRILDRIEAKLTERINQVEGRIERGFDQVERAVAR